MTLTSTNDDLCDDDNDGEYHDDHDSLRFMVAGRFTWLETLEEGRLAA